MNTKAVKLDYQKVYDKGFQLARKKDFYKNRLGLFLLIGIQSGLRSKDIFNIEEDMLEYEDNGMWIHFKAFKTGKPGRAWVDATVMDFVKCAFDQGKESPLFYNKEYGSKLSHPWISGHLKKLFKAEYVKAERQGLTVSVHSLRKTAGTFIYDKFGLEMTRQLLQHQKYETTKAYIEEDKSSFEDKMRGAFSA